MPEPQAPRILGSGAARSRAFDSHSTDLLIVVRRWLSFHTPGHKTSPDVPSIAGIVAAIDAHLGATEIVVSDPDTPKEAP
jgi:hypothetical protein